MSTMVEVYERCEESHEVTGNTVIVIRVPLIPIRVILKGQLSLTIFVYMLDRKKCKS